MSRSMHARLLELATQQSSKSSARLDNNLDLAHARLTSASRRSKRYNHLRKVSEESLRTLASSFGLDTWADEPSNGILILSITGKIIVVDIGLEMSTNLVKSCTLVLASEDGLQDEITVDGRDTMFLDLAAGRLDSFSRNLEKLAFLDRHSDPSNGLSLFHVQDVLREALKRKLKDKADCLAEPINGSSHLNMPLIYYTSHRHLSKDEDSKRESVFQANTYKLALEIEEQPVAARFERAAVESFSVDEIMLKPVLRYPKIWLDSAGNWLTLKQLSTTRFIEHLRYALAFDPPIDVPQSIVQELAQTFPPRVEVDVLPEHATSRRTVYTPSGPHSFGITSLFEEPRRALRAVAFAHPKEIEQILSLARQFAICQQLTSTLHDSTTSTDAITSSITVSTSLVTDVATTIDNRRSIMLSIVQNSNNDQSSADATVLILPDGSLKCWHRHNQQAFTKAIKRSEDLIVSLVYANECNRESQSDTASSVAPDPIVSVDNSSRLDFRKDRMDSSTRELSASEVKQGCTYTVPVDSKVETKSTSAIDPKSPGYLAALGSFLRSQDDVKGHT